MPTTTEPQGCPVRCWDGPYSYRCNLGAAVGICAKHGPFEREKDEDADDD